MKRWALLCGAMLLFAGIASAQDEKVEVFGGYSYVRASDSLLGTSSGSNFNGGSGSVAYNFTPMFAVVADVGGYHNSQSFEDFNIDATAVSYMFGPKVSYHAGPITPFVQVLLGGTHLSGTGTEIDCGDARVHREGGVCSNSVSQNAFSMTVGGGVDWNVTHHIGVRIVQAEYYMTRFNIADITTSDQQNNLRLSAGVTFRF